MRQIIDGLAYDTDKAKQIGNASARRYATDFGYWTEALYRTKAGRFFLHGKGNAASSWATHHGNSSGPGEGIRVMTEAEAQAWAERYLEADEYETIWTAEDA